MIVYVGEDGTNWLYSRSGYNKITYTFMNVYVYVYINE